MQFIAQPFDQIRLGEFLLAHLVDPQWNEFRAAVAFVKRSGTQYIRQPLRDFSARAQVRISVGVDLNGTSTEGLAQLLEATPPGSIFVYRNNGPYTFHPKVYVFKSAQQAEVLVGSGNLTGGGLFTNYEASLAVSLDRNDPGDVQFLQLVETTLNRWSQPQNGLCYELTQGLLDRLVEAGLVRSEAALAAMQRATTTQPVPPGAAADQAHVVPGQATAAAPLFMAVAVPPAPTLAAPQPAVPMEADTAAECAFHAS